MWSKIPYRYTAFNLTLGSISGSGKEHYPLTYEEAMISPVKMEWNMGMKEEIDGITEKKVWAPGNATTRK